MIQDFPDGRLWMSDEPLEALARDVSWAQDPTNSVIALVATVLLIIFMRDYFILWTPILRCLVRPKANVEMEHSIQLARTRNRASFIMGLPILLIADRFGLISSSMLLSAGILTAYVFLRRIMSELLPHKRLNPELRTAVRRTWYTFTIVMAVVMLVTVGLWALFDWEDSVTAWVLTGEAVMMLLWSMIREAEILASVYHPLVCFLYLCGLEVVPASALIASALLVA